ncbi:MAG: hypothetical protein ACE5OR_11945 [bacterium]
MGGQQMTRRMSKGKCNLCDGTFSKAAMTKHLGCCKRREVSETPLGDRRWRKTKILHLVVEGRNLPGYWMHIEAPVNATLEDLDDFLRDTWVECCGHMSAFTIQERRYTTGSGIDAMWIDFFGLDAERDMDVALGEVLVPGTKFRHEYDFGTTTDLTLRVISEREGKIKGKPIKVLARNDPPSIPGGLCGKIATKVCVECVWSGEGWLCDRCARKHECGEEMLLPVANSPRVGMCGYTG